MKNIPDRIFLYKLLDEEIKTPKLIDKIIMMLQENYEETKWTIATAWESTAKLNFDCEGTLFEQYIETAKKVFKDNNSLLMKENLPPGYKWLKIAPIRSREQILGVMMCLGNGKNYKYINEIGNDIGFVYQQYRLKRKLIKDTILMNSIIVAEQGLASSLVISPLLNLLLPQLRNYLDNSAVRLYMWDNKTVVYYDVNGEKTEFDFPEKVSIVRTAKEKNRALMVTNAYNNPDYNQKVDSLYENKQAINIIAAPVKVAGNVKGVLLVNNNYKKNIFVGSELVWVRSICGEIGANLEKMKLYKDMHKFFLSSIESLAAAIEAKDPYTHGHSRRVNLFCLMIGEELGVNDKTMDDIKLSALLHDIGKIAIPEAVLLKTGKLTDREWDKLKEHPVRGALMLEPVKEFAPFLPGIKHHHEHYNGNGYPDGISGDEIPLIARIISVADAFDAMTSKRIYRDAMSEKDAIVEIERCNGTQFDPAIADAFIKIYKEKLRSGGFNENNNM
ncbi:HD domain-containing phosphohydrolase [Elusimicrobiota bacterium]